MEIIFASLLPALLLLLYIWWRDPQKEPVSWLLRGVLLGVLICLPVILVEHAVGSLIATLGVDGTLFGTTLEAFFVAAVPEESFKLLALWLLLRRNPHFDERYDGIMYAVCVGLGFAGVENLMYVFANPDGWQSVALSRALLAVPGHYAFAVLMGYYYSVHHFVNHTPATAILTLLMPVLAHGVYDALALSGQVDAVVGGLCFVILICFCVKMQKFAYGKVLALLQQDERTRMEA